MGNESGTRIEMVMDAIRQRVSARTLARGARLPSVRAFAVSMQVSKSTVVEAYERLAAEGLIGAKPGAGFFVKGPAPLSLAEMEPKHDREVDPLWISRQSLEATAGYLKPGCGWLPSSWMPEAGLRRALRMMARGSDQVFTDYGMPLGHPGLRQLLAQRLVEQGIEVFPQQIMLTESGTQAIDLLCRFFLEPGDTVLVDDPCYFNFHALLRAHQAKVVSVAYTPSGPDVDQFARVLDEHRPRLYITNSTLHNPTGASLWPAVAHRVLKLADAADMIIIEDDIFGDFAYGPATKLAAFDGVKRVIHIGSFSKTLSASVRCGFITAPLEWIDGLVDLKIATSFGGPHFSAEFILTLLKDGSYRKHMDKLRARLSRAMVETVGQLKKLDIQPWIEPEAGMLLWCRLPDGMDAARLAQHALAEQVILAPGNAFSLSQQARGFLRFNVAQCADPRVFAVLRSGLKRASSN